jgi:hypothetical protein
VSRKKRKSLTVVLRPPVKVTTTDVPVEDEADDTPDDVVSRGGWRNESCRTEDERPVDILDKGRVPLDLNETSEERQEGTCEEKVQQAVVELPVRERARRTDDTPDNGCGGEDFSVRAGETIGLMRMAHVLDVGEHPRLNTELYCASNDGCDHLTPKHWAGPKLNLV